MTTQATDARPHLTLDDLLAMSRAELHAVLARGLPLDLPALADTRYTGVDLSMPAWFHRHLWRVFRKTFHHDPKTGALRGWNVMVEQTGWDWSPAPKLDRRGRPRTFGHYEVRSAQGERFPGGWAGAHYLDYRVAGNRALDLPARLGYCPLVSVNRAPGGGGDPELLLGWEVFKVGPALLPIGDFWALKLEGPLAAEEIVPRPRR